ncbi:MAG: PD-(D/E)XK nuclease family protein [Flavobacteriaceae bacterium]|nr:PD-(D/E)XK nuclease family protein [Flavobacteriaceae bacterium]
MSIYRNYSEIELEEHFSNFLIDSWSYSKVSQFSRNEKAFEMFYVFGYGYKKSSTAIAGNAYHFALENYFSNKKEGNNLDIVELEILAVEYIDSVPSNDWKLQKTTPTVEDCIKKATSTSISLLRNFISEISVYEKDLKNILDVEIKCNEFLTVNGVDIPLPCRAKIDLVIETNDNKTVIIDHKSKAYFSSEEELSLSIGVQAMTYVKSYEAKTGIVVDEVWFVENKYSQNRDKSPQLNCFKVELTDDVRKLYEAILYEPLRKMVQAVNDPDYVYMINDSDNYVDKAELYDFWAKTMICEIEEFNVPEAKRELISKRLKKVRDASISTINPKVIKNFRSNASKYIQYDLSNKDMTQEEKIEHVLRTFGIMARVSKIFKGYSSNSYLLEVSAGTKISSIHNYRLDIANAINVSNIRISKDLMVYEEKSYLSIEVSKKRDRDLIWDSSELNGMKIPIGKDNFENTIYWDLENQSTPHMLICGATGSGKSVSIKSTIEYSKLAGVKEIIIFDPKYEFTSYKKDSKVSVYNDIIEIEEEMKKLVDAMNEMVQNGIEKKTLVVFDEFADAVANSRKGKELDVWEDVQDGFYRLSSAAVLSGAEPQPKMKRQKTGELKSLEENLRILLQKGRSTGFRIISATQRASVKVITGDAKVNFPVQVCFRVPKETDSRVVIDEAGAECLAGSGDGLMRSPDYEDIVRFQAFYKK